MSKICPQCRRKQENPAHLGCDKCRVPFINEDELIKTFSTEELKIIAGFLLKDWRVYVVASIGLLLGIGLLYWQVHEQIKAQIDKFQITASNQVATAYAAATNQLTTKFENFAQDASNQVVAAYSSVTNQIAVEFQTPRIQQTVENVAKGQAREILQENVQPEVDRFQAEADFLRLAMKARAYDFKAYQQLLTLEGQTNDDSFFAKQVVAEIDRSLEEDRTYKKQNGKPTYMQFEGTNTFKGPFTSDEIVVLFPSATQNSWVANREGFINTANDLSDPLFMPQFISFLTNETDLGVADMVVQAISKLSNQDFHPHDFYQIQQWWRLNQTNFTIWPIDELTTASDLFAKAQYRQAAASFGKILHADPSADSSRAAAVICDWELGDTNEAVSLVKGFKNPDGRWAMLALAKAQLESGNISNATAQLVFIDTNFPGFLGTPRRGFNAWRKVDWDLFDRLVKSSQP